MNLSDYALPGADPDLAEPLASRLLKLLDYFGGRVMILSGRRSRAAQQKLYDDWVKSGYTVPPTVAVPGTSNHERGLAADLERYDHSLSWGEVHYTAAAFGLIFRLPSEDWHCEADPAWIEPALPPEAPDMTLQELAHAFGPKAVLKDDGVIYLPLINDTLNGTDLYPLGDVLVYIHQDEKMARLGG